MSTTSDDIAIDLDEPSRRGPSLEGEQLGARTPSLWVVAAALLVLALFVVGVYVRNFTLVSPIDEMQHFDYLEKISRFEFVRPGDFVGEAAMREEACRGIDAAFVPPPCDSPEVRPDQFQEAGYATAAGQSPIYYFLSGVVARAVRGATGLDSLMTAARLVGGLWLAAGLFMTWVLLRDLQVRPAPAAVALAMIALAPTVLHVSATVNPDGALLLCGASVFVASERWARGRLPLAALAAVVVVSVAVEKTAALAVLGAGAYLLVRVRWGGPSHRGVRASLIAAAAVVASIILALAIVSAFVGSLGGQDPGLAVPKNAQFHTDEVGLHQVVPALGALVTPLRTPQLVPDPDVPYVHTVVMLCEWVFLAAIGAVLLRRVTVDRSAMVAAGSITLLVGGPLFVLYNALGSTYFAIPARYGLAVVPVLGVAVGDALQTRAAQTVVAGLVGCQAVVLAMMLR